MPKYLNGTKENDVLHVYDTANYVIDGAEGDDRLTGGIGHDLLIGGAGNDTLSGGLSNDIYRFSKGFGNDVIEKPFFGDLSIDTIEFTDIKDSEVILSHKGNDLVISIKDTADTLTLKDYFGQVFPRLELFKFSNDVKWTCKDIGKAGILTEGDDKDNVLKGVQNWGFTNIMHGYKGNDKITGGSGNDVLYGDEGDDRINGEKGMDIILGGAGDDQIDGGECNDILYGEDGDDKLLGSFGDDILIGGAGNDELKDLLGNDTFQFSKGFGKDKVTAFSLNGTDAVRFVDINSDEVEMTRNANDLVITVKNSDDELVIKNYYGKAFTIDRIVFADDVVLDTNYKKNVTVAMAGTIGDDIMKGLDLKEYSDSLYGGMGNDEIYGESGGDFIYGDCGNDTLYGGSGADVIKGGDGQDILDGGADSDWLFGGIGSDTYRIYKGYGVETINDFDLEKGNYDIIKFRGGLKSTDATVTLDGANLEISFESGEKAIIYKYLKSPAYNIEEFQFDDGVVWTTETINSMALNQEDTKGHGILYGTGGKNILSGLEGCDLLFGMGGADILNGDEGNDLLDGGTGNDMLNGGDGNDTYIFKKWYGTDTITDHDSTPFNTDVVQFSADFSSKDAKLTTVGKDLEISFEGSTDKLIVSNYFKDDSYKVELFQFTDGIIWNHNEVTNRLTQAMAVHGAAAGGEISTLDRTIENDTKLILASA